MNSQCLSDYTAVSKYAIYLKDKKRRETWEESVQRCADMMVRKYPSLEKEINQVYASVKRKEVLGSMRAMQFGGIPIERHNARAFNCCASYCDRLRFFAEAFYLLLCGCGTGFSVQKHHITFLPNLSSKLSCQKENKIFVVPDSIEGWADCASVLLTSYHNEAVYGFEEYLNYNVDFDFSQIREKGAALSHGCGKAPGPEPLKKAIEECRKILDRCVQSGQKKLRSIDAYDIMMHLSDSVLSGGIRRSASICLFSPDDELMLNAKVGNWFYENPQRGRSNNSVVLKRDETSFELFQKFFEMTKQWGEPGFVWVYDNDVMVNPCQPAWASVLTKKGLSTIGDVNIGDEIWSKQGWTKIINKWSTGVKKVYRYRTTSGVFYGTENHKVISNLEKIEAKDAESIDCLAGPEQTTFHNNQDVLDGLMIGDGAKYGNHKYVGLYIGNDDSDYFDSEVKYLIHHKAQNKQYTVTTTITPDELSPLPNRKIPSRFFANKNTIAGFLKGLYSANGSIVANRVTLKTSSSELVEQVQLMLSSLGIRSYYTTNKPNLVQFKNDEYLCKESYDINISTDKDIFAKTIGFIQSYKQNKLQEIISNTRKNQGKLSYDIREVSLVSEEEVFDITVDNESHTYWTGGVNVSNCAEISFFCRLLLDRNDRMLKTYRGPLLEGEAGKVYASGWAFCNLSTINIKSLKGATVAEKRRDFFRRCADAAFIGTLQAGFTEFPYLGPISEEIAREEALLGVSLNGIMNNPEVILDPWTQRKGARIVKAINKRYSKLIGIKPCARGTCVKPEGTTAGLLMCDSGCNDSHARKYIRHVQANAMDVPFQYFKSVNPDHCEPSSWSANGTDEIMKFLCEAPKGSIFKKDVSAIQKLEHIRMIQENWVTEGRNLKRCVKPYLNHNVSNTVVVKEDEWESVAKHVYRHRNSYCCVSMISNKGDKDYMNAPFTAVHNRKRQTDLYGRLQVAEAEWLISRLDEINGDYQPYKVARLWLACDAVLGKRQAAPESESIVKAWVYHTLNKWGWRKTAKTEDCWVEKVKKWADERFKGDLLKATYCLKDAFNWRLWCYLKDVGKEVDFSKAIEEENNIEMNREVACAGGACSLT